MIDRILGDSLAFAARALYCSHSTEPVNARICSTLDQICCYQISHYICIIKVEPKGGYLQFDIVIIGDILSFVAPVKAVPIDRIGEVVRQVGPSPD